jgi:hypothetical protein
MDTTSLLLLLGIGALVAYWLHSLHFLELARAAGKHACEHARVQFLDDTVASTRLALARDNHGRRTLRRTYRFEFTETGNTRREGQVVMLGERVETVTMEPYEIVE